MNLESIQKSLLQSNDQINLKIIELSLKNSYKKGKQILNSSSLSQSEKIKIGQSLDYIERTLLLLKTE